MSDWPIVRIDELSSKAKGSIAIGPFGSRMKSDCYVPSGIPVIRGTNITGGPNFEGGFVYITEEKANKLGSANVYQDDLVFPHRGAIGEVGIILEDKRYVISSSLMKLTCDREKANPKFVYYFFRSKIGRYELLKNASQVGTPGIGQPLTSLKGIELQLPPISIQDQIEETLTLLDDKIELNRQTNQTLEQIAQAIFKSWFVDFEPVKAKQHIRSIKGNDEQTERAAQAVIAGAVNLNVITSATDLSALDRQLTQALSEKLAHQTTAQREQLATTAGHFPDQLVESELGLIPERWEVGGMKDCCLRVESGGTPKRSKSDFWNGDIRWLSSGEVRNIIILDTKEKITEAGLKNSSAKLWPSGSIVVAMYGATAGQICLLVNEMTANQACCALIPKKHYQSFIFFSARRSIESLSGKASGSAQQNLNKSLVAEHRVLISPEKVLEAFETFTSSLLGGWIKNIEQNVVLSELRDSLLPKLLSGELAPNKLHQTRN